MTRHQVALFAALGVVVLSAGGAAAATLIARQQAAPQAEPVADAQPLPVQQADGAPAEPAQPASVPAAKPQVITARAYLAEDLGTGEVLASRESQLRWPLASLTKLVTAAVALDRIAGDEPVLVVPVPGGNPSAPGIPVGETYAMSDVLQVMLVSSSNEAAESLAAHVGREEFILAMNAKAAEWGLSRTSFVDPTGLASGNQSTAREVAEVARRVEAAYPQVFAATRQPAVTVSAASSSMAYTARATHQLVGDPGFLGGKTGYTDAARGNLLSLFRIGSRTVALVVLGSEQRFADTRLLRSTTN